MNDPHVVALFYNVKHSASVDYSEAKPLKHEEEEFTITIENDKACFTMKADYATGQEAREAVKDYIEAWEIRAALQKSRPNAFTLEFSHPEIEDRKPTPAALGKLAIGITATSGVSTLSIGLVVKSRYSSYPSPPSGMKITPDVRSMFARWDGYCSRKEPLASMAYFCLTILEKSTGAPRRSRRQAAAGQYRIDQAVLGQIGNLSSEKGDTQARKADGIGRPLTSSETHFLKEAIKALILRASEVAHDPNESRAEIKLSDLPQC